jgi:hypothetical protein
MQMRWYDERRSQQRNLCSFAFTYAQIIEQTIFANITNRTTPQQFEAALQSLDELCRRFERQMDWSHYPASHGMHSCLRDVLTDAEFRLKNLAIMQQAPPAPSQQLISREGIIIDVEESISTSSVETELGAEDAPPDTRNGK